MEDSVDIVWALSSIGVRVGYDNINFSFKRASQISENETCQGRPKRVRKTPHLSPLACSKSPFRASRICRRQAMSFSIESSSHRWLSGFFDYLEISKECEHEKYRSAV